MVTRPSGRKATVWKQPPIVGRGATVPGDVAGNDGWRGGDGCAPPQVHFGVASEASKFRIEVRSRQP
jgi:hypothetical protein